MYYIIMDQRIIYSSSVDGHTDQIPNPENPVYNNPIEDGLSTRILSPADLSRYLKISRISEIPGGGGGDMPVMEFYSVWGNHQCNVASSFPDSDLERKSIDAWLQFTDIRRVPPHSSGYWCYDFERFSNCEFVPQFAYSTLVNQIKHFFVQGVPPFDKGSIITGLQESLHLGRQRFAEQLKKALEKSRESSDLQSRCHTMDCITDLFIEGQLRSTGSSIPIGHLSTIYLTGDRDVYKKNGVVFNDPDFNLAAFNFLFVFIISHPISGKKYIIHLNIDRDKLIRQYADDDDDVSYWTGQFMDYTRTVDFLNIVKEQLMNPATVSHSSIPISEVIDAWEQLNVLPLGQVIRTNTAITVGCKLVTMLVHYKNHGDGSVWNIPEESKIIIPRKFFRITHDGVVGFGPSADADADPYSTSIFKLYPNFQVKTSSSVSHAFNSIHFKSLPSQSMGSFFFPPEYNSRWVDDIIGIRQGDSQPCSLKATWGSLVHSSIEDDETVMGGEAAEEAGAGARARAKAKAAEEAKIAALNAAEEKEEEELNEVRKEMAEARAAQRVAKEADSGVAALVPQSNFGYFLKSIWRKFLDIIRVSTIGINTGGPPNFFDSDDGADLNKMFIQFALEICDEIEQYLTKTPEPIVGYYEFATQCAFNAANDLYQLCFPDVPIADVPISMYIKNMGIAKSLLSNVNEFINSKSVQDVAFSCRLAIFSARAIAYIYSNVNMHIGLQSIQLLARSMITPKTLADFQRIITENAKTEEQLVPAVQEFLYRDAAELQGQGGGRRRVSRKRYKKILTCTRRSSRRRSCRVLSRKPRRRSRRSGRSRRSIRSLIPV